MFGNRHAVRSLTLVALLAATGCGRSAERPAASRPGTAAAVADTPAVVPAGSQRVLAAVREPGATAVVLNVWATWCVPCREEFPDLVRLERDYRDRGVRLVLLSADFEESRADVRAFLARHGVDYPSYIRGPGETDQGFIDGLDPRWSGALPASWVFDGSGKVRSFWEGRADYARFERAVLEAMNTTPQ